MPIESHIHSLKTRHQQLENLLEEKQAQPSTSDVEIADMKRQKLQIKDRIESLKSSSELN